MKKMDTKIDFRSLLVTKQLHTDISAKRSFLGLLGQLGK